MHRSFVGYAVLATVFLTSSTWAQSYEFSIDQNASEIVQSSSIGVPFSGSLKGNYDQESNPDGTRTLLGLFGGGSTDNNDVPYVAAFSIEGSNQSNPLGAFRFTVDPELLTATMSGLALDVLGGTTSTLAATLNLEFDTFRSVAPSSLFLGGFEVPIPLGDVEIQSFVMTQTADAIFTIVPGEGDQPDTIAGMVPVDLTFEMQILDQEISGEPLPIMLPLTGTYVENDNGARIEIVVNFEFDQPLPAAGLPIENIPFDIPTILPPGSTASLLMSGTDSEGSTAGVWDLLIVADGEDAGCAGDPDINGDGLVNGADLTIVLANWNAPGGPADVNCDDIVDGEDLTIVLAFWTGV